MCSFFRAQQFQALAARVFSGGLADRIVLAITARQIAAELAERKYRSSRIEMVEGLLFNRVNAEARGQAVAG